MRTRGWTRVFALVAAGLLAMGVPAHGQDSEGLTDEEAAVAAAARPTPPNLVEASRDVRGRIQDHVDRNGTAHSFGAYVDTPAGVVVLETDAPRDVVDGIVGGHGDVVRVQPGRIEPTSRKSDTAPFYGGSGVALTIGGAACSTGFAVKNAGGTRFLVTAGHCFEIGQVAVTENGGLAVGTATNQFKSTFDMELLKGKTYDRRIFLGGVDGTTSAQVLSAHDPVKNAGGYCHSGRTTGERCGHTVTDDDAMACDINGCKYPVVAYTGGTIHTFGDSGAPFFVKDGVNVRIRGIVYAATATTGYVEPWGRISTKLGVTVLI